MCQGIVIKKALESNYKRESYIKKRSSDSFIPCENKSNNEQAHPGPLIGKENGSSGMNFCQSPKFS